MDGIHRWCESCGSGMSQQQWQRSSFCRMCGALICKDSNLAQSRAGPVLEGMVPGRVIRPLQATLGVVLDHPAVFSVGSIGIGAAGIAVSPLVLSAGMAVMAVGVISVGLSAYGKSRSDGIYSDLPSDWANVGMKLGLALLAVGALAYATGYVVLGAGGLAIVTGLGLGAYSGVKAITNRRQSQIIVSEPLLLEGGDNESG